MNPNIDFILEEMDNLGADGVDFAPIFSTFPLQKIHCSYTREEWINSCGAYPKSGRYYWKIINGNKVYLTPEIHIERNNIREI